MRGPSSPKVGGQVRVRSFPSARARWLIRFCGDAPVSSRRHSGNDEREATVSQRSRGVLDADGELTIGAVTALTVRYTRDEGWSRVSPGLADHGPLERYEWRHVSEREAVEPGADGVSYRRQFARCVFDRSVLTDLAECKQAVARRSRRGRAVGAAGVRRVVGWRQLTPRPPRRFRSQPTPAPLSACRMSGKTIATGANASV